MKELRKLLLTILSIFTLISGIIIGDSVKADKVQLVHKKTLTVGLEGTYAPFSYRKNGKLTGFEVELAKELGKEMGYKVKIIPTKWDGLLGALQSKRFDMVINDVAITKEREKQFAFSEPYIYSKSVLIVKKDDNSIKNLKDIKGKKIATSLGTVTEKYVKKFGGIPVSSDGFNTSMAMIKQGRVAANINSYEAFAYYQKQEHDNELKAVKIPESQYPLSKSGILMNKGNVKLVDKTNKALNELRKKGILKKLSEKYFGTNITDK